MSGWVLVVSQVVVVEVGCAVDPSTLPKVSLVGDKVVTETMLSSAEVMVLMEMDRGIADDSVDCNDAGDMAGYMVGSELVGVATGFVVGSALVDGCSDGDSAGSEAPGEVGGKLKGSKYTCDVDGDIDGDMTGDINCE